MADTNAQASAHSRRDLSPVGGEVVCVRSSRATACSSRRRRRIGEAPTRKRSSATKACAGSGSDLAFEVQRQDLTPSLHKGQWRDPDVQTFTSGDALYAQTGGGTSLFDKKDVFGDMFWHSFEIPAGTEIPDSLKVEGPDWNPVYKANHYQIECKAKTMRVDSMKGALDNLARNAIVRKIALASH